MNIGIVKPDYKISGGFEVVVNQLKLELERRNYNTKIINVDATDQSLRDIPYSISQELYSKNTEFYRYINSFWKYMKMDLSRYDVVISTQPPSFAVQHPRHIALFYHHNKPHYDLSNLVQEVGLQQPYHRKATEVIREIDTISLSKVSTILAGSQTIKKRIERFNKLTTNVDVIYAGIDQEIYDYDGHVTYECPIVVGRHEFPKRPELFVAAMKKVTKGLGRIVGVGGRTEDLKKIDQLLTYSSHENIQIPDEIVWKRMSNGYFTEEHERLVKQARSNRYTSNIVFAGRVSREQLFNEYAKALCVVCPAYEEDYGLTAIEAMAFKKPVIACKDGGGYAELIIDGVNGFLVDPSSDAISKAIQTFMDNPQLAKSMGMNAYETSRKYHWNNTASKLMETINGNN